MNKDIVIIGNGILAYSTAFALINFDPKVKITIIGPQERQGSGSVAAGAMLNCFAEVTSKTLSSAASIKKFEMALQALNLWPEWINNLNNYLPNDKQIVIHPGTYVLLNAESGVLDSDNYEAMLQVLNKYNEEHEEVSPKSIPGLNPTQHARPLRAHYLPREGYIESELYLIALHNILVGFPNINIIDDQVTFIHTPADKAKHIETKNGEKLEAEHIIIAAGSYSQFLIDQIAALKDRIPRLLAGVGYSVLLEKPSETTIKNVIRTPNRAGACGLHAVPRNKNSVYIGASNNVFLSPQHTLNAGMTQFILKCAIEQIDQDLYSSKILKWQIGNRPATIDTFPLIGKTSIKGLWLLTGTYRDGFHQSPLLAQQIAAEILGKKELFKNIFLPERSPLQTMTMEESINEFVHHYMAGSYEHSMRLPKIIRERNLERIIRYETELLYEKLETNYGLTPDILFMLYLDPTSIDSLSLFKSYLSKGEL